MKLPDKIWITEETAQYGGHTEPYLSINDPADPSPGAVPYIPLSRVERLEARVKELEGAIRRGYIKWSSKDPTEYNQGQYDAYADLFEALCNEQAKPSGGEGKP